MEDIYVMTTMHREVTPDEAERCRELIEELFPEENEPNNKPTE